MRKIFLVILSVCVVIGFFIGYETKPSMELRVFSENTFSEKQDVRSVVLMLPAVDTTGKGTLASLRVDLMKGRGEVFLRLDPSIPLINPDTQSSLKVALDVAKKISGNDLRDINLYYSISSDAEVVGGQSAGAALAVATLSLLRRESLRKDALITGTVEVDGSIGQVGKILEKAKAAKEAGYKILLVPKEESRQQVSIQSCEKEVVGRASIVRCRTELKWVNVEEETGIKVIEVSDVGEAYSILRA